MYLILKDLPGTYCNTIFSICDTEEQATTVCNSMNEQSKYGIKYSVRNALDFKHV